jgi:hypothetical protein
MDCKIIRTMSFFADSMFLLKHNFINVIILVAVPNSEIILHINSFIAESESFSKSLKGM